MKKTIMAILLLLMPFLPRTVFAAQDGVITLDQVLHETEQTVKHFERAKIKYREHYRTWDVVEVTNDTIFLERTKKNGEVVNANIERTRRPHLVVGDRVRYDKKNNRLRKTLDK